MQLDPERCRSLLFVPAGNERFLNSALRGDADVIQIDLEDAIAPNQKEVAREHAKKDLAAIVSAGRAVSVRVNAEKSLLENDLDAIVSPGLSALTIPKVENAEMVKELDDQVTRLEENRMIPSGGIRFIAQIESARGILNVREIARSSPRLAALGIGMEDLIAEVGGKVDPDSLYFPAMQSLYAAREAGITPIGYLGSITVYKDVELFQEWIRRARNLGFEGGFCIHPNQVSILNETFRPTADEVAEALGVFDAAEKHQQGGVGAFAHNGKMVDAPVVERAKRILRLNKLYAPKETS